MTGFIGERTNRKVALVTTDFRRYHELVPFFEQYGIQILGLRPGDEVPTSVRVLIDGPPSDPRSVAARDDMEATWLAVVAALDARRNGSYRRVTIGIDPGETIGLAVLVDGSVFWVQQVRDVDAAVARVAAWRTGLEARGWHVHVGDGAPAIGQAICAALQASQPDMHVHVVPEDASSPTAPATMSRHTDAAILIAMREAA